MRLPQFPATMPAIEHCITGGGRFSLGSFYLPYHGVGGVKFFFRYKGFVRIFGDDPFFAGTRRWFLSRIYRLSRV